ncbi:MAG: tyrosine/serine-protein phosphatase iphp-type [Chloroflexi bacterium]|nr:tyrosine/serine-protein phosphatase iphp-type [Chloroflexota bacterium]
MLRSVALPPHINGRLFLSSMPGRYEKFDQSRASFLEYSVDHIVCLVALEEVEHKSALYGEALRTGTLPCQATFFPILDAAVPDDKKRYLQVVSDVVARLIRGENILVHCGAGIGRTGIFAISVLLTMGIDVQQSLGLVRAAGSYPETSEQWEFIDWVAGQQE